MAEPTNAEKIEAMARAMATADGYNPDQIVDVWPMNGFVVQGPYWRRYQRQCTALLAAMDAVTKIK